ncbi:MAG TPA: glycosyltransferase family 39 protein [Stellaceae bacterium]|nr:glycosyltransferase family 39 protein [Stellaceae bacterium]
MKFGDNTTEHAPPAFSPVQQTATQHAAAGTSPVLSGQGLRKRGDIAGALCLPFGIRSIQPAVAVAAALVLLTALRLALAASMPLAPDEAYYWTWSHALAAGYFDHPPMVALWIRAGTWLAGDTALGIRLLGPLSAALGSALLWDAADRLLPGRNAGMATVLLLNSTILVGVGAIVVTPDSPLLLFWILSLWAMARIVARGSGVWWLAVGLFVGLAAASKYTGILLALGIGIWLAVAGRQWLRRREPYAGAVLALAVVTPVLWWNATHEWVSFLRQGVRVGVWSPGRAPQYLLELLGGQIAVATPLIFLFCVAGMALALRSAWRRRDPAWGLLAIFSLLPALVFIQHAIGDRVQANWPAILYPAAGIAAAGLGGRFWRRLRAPAIALGLLMTAAVYVQAAFGPMALPSKLDPIALQMEGWRGLAATVEEARRSTGASFVAADQCGLAAELARELPPGVPVIAIGPRWWSFDLPPAAVDGMTGMLVESDRHATPIWHAGEEIGTATREHDGIAIQKYRLYRVVPDHSTSAVRLPRQAMN